MTGWFRPKADGRRASSYGVNVGKAGVCLAFKNQADLTEAVTCRHYSGTIPASLITLLHLAKSDLINEAYSCGVPP